MLLSGTDPSAQIDARFWIRTTRYVGVSGMIRVYPPGSFRAGCSPPVLHVTLPKGVCRDKSDSFEITFSEEVLPNTRYEFVQPSQPTTESMTGGMRKGAGQDTFIHKLVISTS